MNISGIKGAWSEIWESLQGIEHDYTKISIRKAVVLLAIPMILEMFMESLFALVDTIVVSHLGDDAVAVVGFTDSMMTIVYALGLGVGMGATGLISRRIGEKNIRKAINASCQSINLGIALSLPIIVIGILYAPKLLEMMKATPSAVELGTDYARIMLVGNILVMLLFVNNAILRSAGNAAYSFRVLFFANLINIILDPCLVYGWWIFPEMGVTGAAVATNIGRGLGVVYQFYILFKGSGVIKIDWEGFRFKLNVMWKVLYLSGGGIFQYIIATSSWIVLYRFLGGFDKSEIVSGYTLAIRAFIFFILPAWGLSNAASTLVGQNLGAKNPERAEKSVWYTVIANVGYMTILMILFELLPGPIINMFNTEKESYDVAIRALRIISIGLPFYGLGMTLTQAFNGAGDPYTPTYINFIAFWLMEIPIAYFLSQKTAMLENGVFISVCAADIIICILAFFIFIRGKLKPREV
ncbi:MAG: MATE family efflux transporter [Bacteroidales bacterium]|nr:MATE family efflux transporter [Bacteroidales bacterium]